MKIAVVQWTTNFFWEYWSNLVFVMLFCLNLGHITNYQIYLRTTRFPKKVVLLTTKNCGVISTPDQEKCINTFCVSV